MKLRRLFVISDLHIGGAYPAASDDPQSRGFRVCTRVDRLTSFVNGLPRLTERQAVELVINGDFVDFLAETSSPTATATSAAAAAGEASWVPFVESGADAAAVFSRLAARDAPLFDALRDFLRSGGRLTLMLGNHDIELSLPAVRRELENVLDGFGRDLHFVYDGQAYSVGPVLIEHGNRYDPWNVVAHDALRRLRSTQSRGERQDAGFEAPAGSHLVAGVMNKVKQRFPFVDLLKPECEAVLPMLLALAPEYRAHIFAAARLAGAAHGRRFGFELALKTLGDMGAPAEPPSDGRRLVLEALSQLLRTDELHGFIAQTIGTADDQAASRIGANGDIGNIDDIGTIGDIGALDTVRTTWGWMRLLAAPPATPLEIRLPALRAALGAARNTYDFCRTREVPSYRKAAEDLCALGWRYVVFGHTHLAKRIGLPGGGLYFNTGTWADLIEFPSDVLVKPTSGAVDPLLQFIEEMRDSSFRRHLRFIPTYAEFAFDAEGAVTSAELRDYAQSAG